MIENDISIHAPVKGATYWVQRIRRKTQDFNPRTREGCDVTQLFKVTSGLNHFNPRTREGCDDCRQSCPYSLRSISIHAPVKGAT